MGQPESQAGGISIHAVDISRGLPAEGLFLSLFYVDGESLLEIASGLCGADGVLQHPISDGAGVFPGIYELHFEVGAYYRGSGLVLPDPAFLEIAHFRFGIANISEHFHLPIKFTPWGYSLFRGGA